jgi:hypothetical protein
VCRNKEKDLNKMLYEIYQQLWPNPERIGCFSLLPSFKVEAVFPDKRPGSATLPVT